MCKTCLWKSSPLTKSFHWCCTAPNICAGLCFWTLRPKAVRSKMTDQHMCVVVFHQFSIVYLCQSYSTSQLSSLPSRVSLSPAHSLFFQNCIAKGSTFRSVCLLFSPSLSLPRCFRMVLPKALRFILSRCLFIVVLHITYKFSVYSAAISVCVS